MFKHKDVQFEEVETKTINGKRHYITPKGNFPSITTVLSVLSRKGIAEWRARVGEAEADKIGRIACGRGTNVHLMCEQYVNNELDESKFMPDVKAMFNSIKPILKERIGEVYAQEMPMWSSYLGVAGRVDCIAEFDGKLAVIDYKTASKTKKKEWISSYFQQASAYCVMFEERTGVPVNQLVTLIVVDNEEPQIFIEKRDTWTSKLIETIGVYNERENN